MGNTSLGRAGNARGEPQPLLSRCGQAEGITGVLKGLVTGGPVVNPGGAAAGGRGRGGGAVQPGGLGMAGGNARRQEGTRQVGGWGRGVGGGGG